MEEGGKEDDAKNTHHTVADKKKFDRIIAKWQRLKNNNPYNCIHVSALLRLGHRLDQHSIFIREYIISKDGRLLVVSLPSSTQSPPTIVVHSMFDMPNAVDDITPTTFNERSVTYCLAESTTDTDPNTVLYFNMFYEKWQFAYWTDTSELLCVCKLFVLVPPGWSTREAAIASNVICHCGKLQPTSLCDGCRVYRYCSQTCQQADWPNHSQLCIRERTISVDGEAEDESKNNDVFHFNQCMQCRKQAPDMKRCGRCKVVQYCGRECQRAQWSQHKSMCDAVLHYRTVVGRPYYMTKSLPH